MLNLRVLRDEDKALDDASNSDALLTLEGLVASSRELGDERKIGLLQFLASLRGASPSRDALKFSLRLGKEEGVW